MISSFSTFFIDFFIFFYFIATHFTVGNDEVNYASEHAKKFQEPNKESYKLLEQNPDIHKNHYSFGDKSLKDPNFYKSMYDNGFNHPHEISKNEKVRDERADRGSNIVFGTDKSNTYLSEHHDQFYFSYF